MCGSFVIPWEPQEWKSRWSTLRTQTHYSAFTTLNSTPIKDHKLGVEERVERASLKDKMYSWWTSSQSLRDFDPQLPYVLKLSEVSKENRPLHNFKRTYHNCYKIPWKRFTERSEVCPFLSGGGALTDKVGWVLWLFIGSSASSWKTKLAQTMKTINYQRNAVWKCTFMLTAPFIHSMPCQVDSKWWKVDGNKRGKHAWNEWAELL